MSAMRIAATVAVLVLVGLTACSTPSSKPPTSEQEIPGPNVSAAAPKPSATPTADPTVMFTISATVTSPAGAVADIVQTVYKPVAQTDNQAADYALLTDPGSGCGDWPSVIPDPEYVVAIATVTDRSPAGVSWPYLGVAFVNLMGRPMYTGPFDTWGAACSSVIAHVGTVRGVTAVSSGPADTGFGWANVNYGIGTGAAAVEYEGWDDENITNCKLTLSQWAIDNSAIAAGWATETPPYPGVNCTFGEELYSYPLAEY